MAHTMALIEVASSNVTCVVASHPFFSFMSGSLVHLSTRTVKRRLESMPQFVKYTARLMRGLFTSAMVKFVKRAVRAICLTTEVHYELFGLSKTM